MTFSHPLALFGLAVIPLILAFYLWRARHQRRLVSSTWLWSEAVAEFGHRPQRRLPIREPLLLLQLLAALLLILFLAGPRFSQAARVHQIVVLDGSVAMAAHDLAPSRFAQAQQRVEAMIDRLRAGESLSLVEAGPRARLIGDTATNGNLGAAVRHLGPPGGPADLDGAAALVQGLAATAGVGEPRVTYLAAPETPLLGNVGLPLTVERIGKQPLDDQSIGSLTVACNPAGTACQTFALARNTAAIPARQNLAVWADGQSLGRQTVLLPAHGTLDLTFQLPRGARILKATLLAPDAVAEDNTAWAIVPATTPLRALVVSDNPGQLAHALRAIPGLTVETIATTKFEYSGYQRYDFMVLDNFAPDGIPTIPALLVDPPASTEMLRIRAANVYLPADNVDTADPMVAGLNLYGLATNGEQLDIPAWAHVVVGGRNGPLLMHGIWNGARTAVIAFDIGRSAFAQELTFPLLITRLVQWLLPFPDTTAAIGDSVALPSDVAEVSDPSGVVKSGPYVTVDQAGIYAVASGTGGRVTGQPLFAAHAAVPGEAIAGYHGNGLPARTASSGTVHSDLWSIVLVIALAALCAEWWVYAKRT